MDGGSAHTMTEEVTMDAETTQERPEGATEDPPVEFPPRPEQEPQAAPESPSGAEGPPAGMGLPQTSLGQRDGQRTQRAGDELLDAAASGVPISPPEQDALLGHYLGNVPKPGTTQKDEIDVEVDLGRDRAKWRCTIKPIGWPQWQESQMQGTKGDGSIDTMVIAAWNVAQGLVKPQLGPVVQRLQAEDPENAPQHAPALLIDFFEKQPGSLLELSQKVLEISKLQVQNDAVREVEAGKT